MSRLTEVINQFSGKRESQLNETKTAGEKVSVLAHGRPAVWAFSMSQYATQQQVDYGSRSPETPENTTVVTWRPMSTTLTAGVVA